MSAPRSIYVISVAAELAGMHPQTLRIYERRGLLNPARTAGGNRRYTDEDIARLRPGAGEDLYAEGTVVRMGNRVGVAAVRIFCGRPGPDTLPIATGSAVYSVFRPGDRA